MTRYVNPFPQHFDLNGDPDAQFNVFFGFPNQDPKLFPKAPFSDIGLQSALPTTIQLANDGSYTQDVFLKNSYSLRIENLSGGLVRETPAFSGIGESVNDASDFATFADAIAASSNSELIISSSIAVDASIGFSDVTLRFVRGGILVLGGGVVITFDNTGQIDADRRQKIFTITAFTQIVFTNRGTIHAGWWGFSIAETQVNNTTFLGFALNTMVAMQGTCRMHDGLFPMNSLTITVSVEFAAFAILGEFFSWRDSITPANNGTILNFPTISGSDTGLSIVHSGTFGGGIRLEGFHLQGPSDHRTTQATTTTGLRLDKFPRSYINISTGFFNNGISATSMFVSEFVNCRAVRCAFGIILDTNSNNIKLDHFIGEVCQVGIRMKEGSGVTIIAPELESCTQGLYVNPDNGVDIRNLIFMNPDYEGNTGTIEIGVDTYNVRNGNIRDIHLIGGHYDSITNFPKIRNATDVTIDVDQQYVQQFDIDSTVSWSMPTTGAFSLASSGNTASKSLNFTEFRTHINQIIGGTHTLTLPDINICPRLTDYTWHRTDTNAGIVLVNGFAGQLMNGVASLGLEGVNSHITAWRDPVNTEQWRIKSGGPSGVQRAVNPPSLAAGASFSQAVTVTGIRFNDKVTASFSLDTQGITLSAEVTGSDATLVTFSNPTVGAIDLASGDVFVRGEK